MSGLKICGLQPGDDLSFATSTVVTHTGIVFAPRSRRYVAPGDAAQLSAQLRPHATVLGVFVDSTVEDVQAIVRIAGLSGVQLHGQETPEFCRSLRAEGVTVWKALSVPRNPNLSAVFAQTLEAFYGAVDAILLDAPPPPNADAQVTGGHGHAFAWRDLPGLSALLRQPAPPVWVAGGITPENVSILLDTYSAAGVDVSSGVETEGRKSSDKIHAMMEAVSRHAG